MRESGAKHSLIALKIETWCFRETKTLELFEFKQCYDFCFNIIYVPVNTNIL